MDVNKILLVFSIPQRSVIIIHLWEKLIDILWALI